MVLHHTFDTEAVVSKSGTLVERENVHTVDCLFYEDKGLLDCKKNEEAYEEAANWIVSNVCSHFSITCQLFYVRLI